MFVARGPRRVLQWLRRKEEVSPSSRAPTRTTGRGSVPPQEAAPGVFLQARPRSPEGFRPPLFPFAPDVFAGGFYEGTALRQSQKGRACLLPFRRLLRAHLAPRRPGQTTEHRPESGDPEGRAAEGRAGRARTDAAAD